MKLQMIEKENAWKVKEQWLWAGIARSNLEEEERVKTELKGIIKVI